MNIRDISTLINIDEEIKSMELSAIKLKEIGEKIDMPIITCNIDRILANISVLKHTISDPINICFLKCGRSKI